MVHQNEWSLLHNELQNSFKVVGDFRNAILTFQLLTKMTNYFIITHQFLQIALINTGAFCVEYFRKFWENIVKILCLKKVILQ